MADQSRPPTPDQSRPPTPTTPGSVPSGERAGFGSRLVASLIDGILVFGVLYLVGLAGGHNYFEGSSSDTGASFRFSATGIWALVWFVVPVAYYAVLEGSQSGQTFGKKAMKIRVADFNGGGPIGFGRGLLRYVGRLASSFVCGLGYLWMLWDPEKQTWHDKIATTVVVPTE